VIAIMAMGRSSLRVKQAGFGTSALRSQQFFLLSLLAHLKHSLLALQQLRPFVAVAFLLLLLLQPQDQSSPSSSYLGSVGD